MSKDKLGKILLEVYNGKENEDCFSIDDAKSKIQALMLTEEEKEDIILDGLIIPGELMKIEDVIIGQEALCGDGLGRVKAVNKRKKWIQIDTYYNNKSACWDFENVRLVRYGFEHIFT